MDSNVNQIMGVLGEIRGELKGLRELTQAHHTSVQQRINDMTTANDTRFKGLEKQVAELESGYKGLLVRTAASGGAGGIVTAVLIELIRMKFGG